MRFSQDVIARARALRVDGKTLGQIASELGVWKSTVYHWIRTMPVPVVDGIDVQTRARLKTGRLWSREVVEKRVASWKLKCSERRQAEEDRGLAEASSVLGESKVRDFACLFLAEGTKRSRNVVGVVNTDQQIIRLCDLMMRRFSRKPISYRLFCADDERDRLVAFWSQSLGVDPSLIRFQLKKKVSARRSEFGLFSVTTCDTFFRSRLQGWINWLRSQWASSSTERTGGYGPSDGGSTPLSPTT